MDEIMNKAIKNLAMSNLLKYGMIILYPFILVLTATESYVAVGFLGLIVLGILIASIVYDVKFISQVLKNVK